MVSPFEDLLLCDVKTVSVQQPVVTSNLTVYCIFIVPLKPMLTARQVIPHCAMETGYF